jgi:hypothetical protein
MWRGNKTRTCCGARSLSTESCLNPARERLVRLRRFRYPVTVSFPYVESLNVAITRQAGTRLAGFF